VTIKGIILDIDGVLRRGGEPVPGSPEAVNQMLDADLKICCLTNNSTRTCAALQRSLQIMGYPELPVVGSAQAAAIYISERYGKCRCLVVGERGVVEELQQEGHEVFNAGGGNPSPGEIDCVVAGMDRELTYAKIADALHCLEAGARFIATNTDPTFPMEGGRFMPGAGATIGAIRGTSGVEPEVVVGKPNIYSTTIALRRLGLDPDEVLTIGDRIDTDITAGKAAGTRVAVVLTGVVKKVDDPGLPVFDDLLALVRDLL